MSTEQGTPEVSYGELVDHVRWLSAQVGLLRMAVATILPSNSIGNYAADIADIDENYRRERQARVTPPDSGRPTAEHGGTA